jgi:hypothetical protein
VLLDSHRTDRRCRRSHFEATARKRKLQLAPPKRSKQPAKTFKTTGLLPCVLSSAGRHCGARSSVSTWAAHLDDDHTLQQCGSLDSPAVAFLRSIQRDAQRSCFSIGGEKFRSGNVMGE